MLEVMYWVAPSTTLEGTNASAAQRNREAQSISAGRDASTAACSPGRRTAQIPEATSATASAQNPIDQTPACEATPSPAWSGSRRSNRRG
jgi:hypothetical protein